MTIPYVPRPDGYTIRPINGKFFAIVPQCDECGRPLEPLVIGPWQHEPWEGFETASDAIEAAETLLAFGGEK